MSSYNPHSRAASSNQIVSGIPLRPTPYTVVRVKRNCDYWWEFQEGIPYNHRIVPLKFEFQHLHLYALGHPEQAAMKIVTLREQDLEDLELLLPQMSEGDRQILIGIMYHMSRFRPDWAQKIQYFLEEQGWQID